MKRLSYLAVIFLMLILTGCNSCTQSNLDYGLGWLASQEDTSEIEDAVDLSLPNVGSSGTLPSSVDLSEYFPPIGDQGQYGTCVAWSVGYNEKSFLEAKSAGYTNYTSTDKIASPKDLFWAVDNSLKGADCNGTNFEYAFDVLQNRGVASLTTVPYTGLSDCSQSPESSWTSNAANHKISNYREIDVDKNTIKSYLADGRAVVFGAKLGDQFMDYTSGVLDYQDFNYTGQNAYHAMILCGYDDNVGTNGAFRVVNSWGTSWGDDGYAWVDMDYFCSSNFAFCTFVATDQQTNPDPNNNDTIEDVTSGYDLIAWQLEDQDYYNPNDSDSNDPSWRTSYYNVYNAGENTLNASDDWGIVYLLYNAYDGNDYQILLFDYYSDDYGNPGENGMLDDPNITNQIPAQGYWWNNVNVNSGQSVSDAVFGSDSPFQWTYKLPNVTGDYYLVIWADAFDTFKEADESNNFAYFAQDNGDPIHIVNGVMQNAPTKAVVATNIKPKKGDSSPFETVRNKYNLNTYTTNEIKQKILHDRKTGELQQKIFEYQQNTSKAKVKYTK